MLDEFGDGALDTLEGQGFMRLMNVLEAKAVELTPVDKGTLEDSTSVHVNRDGRKVVGTLTFNAPYASHVHELPPDKKGKRTRAKPGNEYGPAGPKYLERPLRGFVKVLAKDIGEGLQKIWGQTARGRRGKRG
jgi:hypothetical protein